MTKISYTEDLTVPTALSVVGLGFAEALRVCGGGAPAGQHIPWCGGVKNLGGLRSGRGDCRSSVLVWSDPGMAQVGLVQLEYQATS